MVAAAQAGSGPCAACRAAAPVSRAPAAAWRCLRHRNTRQRYTLEGVLVFCLCSVHALLHGRADDSISIPFGHFSMRADSVSCATAI